MNWYPLLFTPVYQEIIWGGKKLWQVLGRQVPYERTAESWELSAHPKGITIVANGPLRGKTISDLIRMDSSGFLGVDDPEIDFPLLVKIIGAQRDLSIQVHPDDLVGSKHGVPGKTEAWYVLFAEKDSRIIYGLKPGISKERLKLALETGQILSCVNQIPVQAGDFIPIPAGCIHALGAGILVAEIQQSSDTTYRLYDWGRTGVDGKPRPLHIREGLEAVNTKLPIPASFKCNPEEGLLFKDQHFSITRSQVRGERRFRGTSTFTIWTVIEGKGTVSAGGEEVALARGSSALLPAGIEETVAAGEFSFLLTMPSILK